MDENQQWFYTDRNGQQAGPVGTTELRTLIAQAAVTDASMVWSEGMTDWKMLGQVEGLTQPAALVAPKPTAIAQPAATNTPSAEINPYAPPTAVESANPDLADGAFHEVLDYGGIGRLSFFLQGFVYSIIAVVVIVAGTSFDSWILMIIAVLALIVVLLRLSSLRLKNMGASGWWLFLFLVPIGGTILQIMLLACPEGYSNTRKLDTPGVIIAVVMILLNVLSFIGNF